MTKNGEGKFYFGYHSSKMQDVSRETRRGIWETQMSHDAVGILTDRKMRQITDVSRKISHATGTSSHRILPALTCL